VLFGGIDGTAKYIGRVVRQIGWIKNFLDSRNHNVSLFLLPAFSSEFIDDWVHLS
jgi:hypothetical protein